MMTLNLNTHTTNLTQRLRPIFGFLLTNTSACGSSGILPYFGEYNQGRKPSGDIWVDSLFGMVDGSDANALNDEPANGERSRSRSHGERFSIP